MAQKSVNASVYDNEQHIKLDGKLSSLGKKEWAAEKRNEITEITISAFQCHTCNYVLEKPMEKCGEMGHDVQPLRVKKRWFECANCKSRTTVIRARIPTISCRKCNSTEWQK